MTLNDVIQRAGLASIILSAVDNGDGTYTIETSQTDYADLYAAAQTQYQTSGGTCGCGQVAQTLANAVIQGTVKILLQNLSWMEQLGLIHTRNPLPATGQPNSTATNNTPNGKTVRVYGPDGKAVRDVDYGDQAHSGYDPEVHDWTWSGNKPFRVPLGRQPNAGEIP